MNYYLSNTAWCWRKPVLSCGKIFVITIQWIRYNKSWRPLIKWDVLSHVQFRQTVVLTHINSFPDFWPTPQRIFSLSTLTVGKQSWSREIVSFDTIYDTAQKRQTWFVFGNSYDPLGPHLSRLVIPTVYTVSQLNCYNTYNCDDLFSFSAS